MRTNPRRPEPKTRLISQAAFARWFGVRAPSVSVAVRTGRIKLTKGLVDWRRAAREWAANTDESKPKGPAGRGRSPGTNGNGHAASDSATLTAHRARREDVRAKIDEMEYRRKLGQLVDREAYDQAAYDRQRRAYKALLAVPARLGPILASISDPTECTRRIRAEMEIVAREIKDLADGSKP